MLWDPSFEMSMCRAQWGRQITDGAKYWRSRMAVKCASCDQFMNWPTSKSGYSGIRYVQKCNASLLSSLHVSSPFHPRFKVSEVSEPFFFTSPVTVGRPRKTHNNMPPIHIPVSVLLLAVALKLTPKQKIKLENSSKIKSQSVSMLMPCQMHAM